MKASGWKWDGLRISRAYNREVIIIHYFTAKMGDNVPKYTLSSSGINGQPYMSASGGYLPSMQYAGGTESPTAAPPQQQPQMQFVQGSVQHGITAEEVAIAKLDSSIASMEEQQMTADPRYAQMLLLKQKIAGSLVAWYN